MNKNIGYIPSLDGLRAVSILIVFASHAGLEKFVPGSLGVTIFFFLSGYLITTLLRQEFNRKGTISLRNFYLRRIFRIWPSFYFILFFGIILTFFHLIPGSLSWTGVLSQICHVANYNVVAFKGDVSLGTGVYWSLAIEEHFYLLFPLVFTICVKRKLSTKAQTIFFCLICLIILLWRCYLVYHLQAPYSRTFFASDTRFDSILFGCILAISANPILDRIGISDRWIKWVLFPGSLMLLVGATFVRDNAFRDSFRYSIQGISLIPIFIAAIKFSDWGIFRFLNFRWVRFLGVLSYSMYLTHHTIILTLKKTVALSLIWQGVIAFVLSVILAILMHYVIEMPFSRLRKKFG